MEAEQKSGKGILLTIGWLSVILLTFNLIPPMLLFFPICIGVVIRRDYQEDKLGSAMIILGIISGITGWLLGIFVSNNFY
ncbi:MULTISPECIES: hypothetical protein [Cytobacillus]|uniref:DUF4190 domain-containing protein n=1 Tax=Cytobacillus oceanisediminis TaxID=665099 RepID=A0ABX3CLS9_9BACI|nr:MULTISPECIES: hypothetical protein [Cytobacillus]OHX42901.1 hypothetical protein BBV17_26650 [Cytobacillus oceanisediminis]